MYDDRVSGIRQNFATTATFLCVCVWVCVSVEQSCLRNGLGGICAGLHCSFAHLKSGDSVASFSHLQPQTVVQ